MDHPKRLEELTECSAGLYGDIQDSSKSWEKEFIRVLLMQKSFVDIKISVFHMRPFVLLIQIARIHDE